VPITFSQEDL
jgi:hypothetical protein